MVEKIMEFTHLDARGQPGMVDIGDKVVTSRTARARAEVILPSEVMSQFIDDELSTKKGPVLQTARLAGTMAVKRTSDLIPLCHPLPIDSIRFETSMDPAAGKVVIECEVKATYKTGVEMEALTGVSVAALTVFDMCKAISPAIVIGEIKVLEKRGGKSDWSAG